MPFIQEKEKKIFAVLPSDHSQEKLGLGDLGSKYFGDVAGKLLNKGKNFSSFDFTSGLAWSWVL